MLPSEELIVICEACVVADKFVLTLSTLSSFVAIRANNTSFSLSTVTALSAISAVAIAVPFQTPVAIVPTEVKEEATTVDLRVLPDNVPAAAVTVIAADPLKLTPLIARVVASTVAVSALPVTSPVKAPANPSAAVIPPADISARS